MNEFKIYTPKDIDHDPKDSQQVWFADLEARFLNSEILDQIKEKAKGIAENNHLTKDEYLAARKKLRDYLRFLEFEYRGIEKPGIVIEYLNRVLNDIDDSYKAFQNGHTDYSTLVNDLREYFTGCTPETMRMIFKYKTAGENKPLWIGKRTEARQFAKWIGLEVSEFNKCFEMQGRPLDSNDIPPRSPNDLKSILKKHEK